MRKNLFGKYASLVLILALLVTMLQPVAVFATDDVAEDATVPVETSGETGTVEPETNTVPDAESDISSESQDTPETVADDGETAEELVVSDYSTFLADLKVLESYAVAYAAENTSENANALVINFIRTGVERYQSGSWSVMAGSENTAFTTYVAEQDTENGTAVSALKNLDNFTIPNGDTVDMGHVFGTLDISWYSYLSGMNAAGLLAREDLGGWAGDSADMMYCADVLGSYGSGTDDADTLADIMGNNYLGADFNTLNAQYLELYPDEERLEHSFTSTDLIGDLDAFYLATELKNGASSISTLVENYFTAELTNAQRASYFLTNRLYSAVKKATIRQRLLAAYTGNGAMDTLEASYGVSSVSNHDNLRDGAVYAFADWLFALAGDDEGTDGTDPSESTGDDEEEEDTDNPYYTVFSSTDSNLAPGITQQINYAISADNKQMVYYIATCDVTRDDVHVYANYKGNQGTEWGMARVSDQIAAAVEKHTNPEDTDNYIENYKAIVGVNADFFNMSTGAPAGALVMEGVEYHGASDNFFGILKNGQAVIGTSADYNELKDQIQEAVGGSMYLIKDGEICVTATTNYYSSRASRTCVGITAEGKVVLMVLDGRQEPFSCGGSAIELAQIMKDAGCVVALNLDGGGSTTFDAKEEGDDEITTVNRPSDGYERPVSSSILVVSTAETSTEFDHAVLETENDYMTTTATMQVKASGVSKSGGAAELPEDAVWSLADATLGSITEDGVFTPTSDLEFTNTVKTYDVVINLTSADGTQVYGSKTLKIIDRTDEDNVKLAFTKDNVDVVYGQSVELPLQMTYNGNPVSFSLSDVSLSSSSYFDTIKGLTLTAVDEDTVNLLVTYGLLSGKLRNSTVTAQVLNETGDAVYTFVDPATINVSYYSEDESYFDFDTAMYGDRSFAWNRTVSNSTYTVETPMDSDPYYTYYVQDSSEDMVTEYTFAIDMQTVEFPEKLLPIKYMLTQDDSATPWDILLQYAERVSALTSVTVKLELDKNFDVDYSGLCISNELFTLTDVTLDENNVLTVTINWVQQDNALSSAQANPVVIVSGLKLTPKDGTAAVLDAVNSGSVSYDMYLGFSAVYSAAQDEEWSEKYGILPYEEPTNTDHPVGGHFYSDFISFTDSYTLDRTWKNGWYTVDDATYYYVDNVPLTGIQYLKANGSDGNSYYYSFDENGVCTGKLTGLFTLDDGLHYALLGEMKTGWVSVTNRNDADGDGEDYYYFDPNNNGAAVDGTQTINGVSYTFTNCILTAGSWKQTDAGPQYMWAGRGHTAGWATIDGKTYLFDGNGVAKTGVTATQHFDGVSGEKEFAFDPVTGAWVGADYTGLFQDGDDTYYVENGFATYAGLVLAEDGYYYYFSSSLKAKKNTSYWITKNNGLMASASYWFDESGRMCDPDTKEPYAFYQVSLAYSIETESETSEISAGTTKWYSVGKGIKMTAGDTYVLNGQTYYFDHWDFNGISYSSTALTINPGIAGAYTAKACYKSAQAEVLPTVSIVDSYGEVASGKYKIVLTQSWNVPEGYSVTATGFVVSTKQVDALTLGASGTTTKTSKLKTADGAYTLKISTASNAARVIYAVAYLTVTAPDGTNQTIYSDPVSCSYNSLTGNS